MSVLVAKEAPDLTAPAVVPSGIIEDTRRDIPESFGAGSKQKAKGVVRYDCPKFCLILRPESVTLSFFVSGRTRPFSAPIPK